MKKLLLLTFLLFFTFSYAQQNDKRDSVNKKNNPPITISAISASPNPFSVKTRISFKSTKAQLIEFSVKNLLGNTVFIEHINAKKGFNTVHFEQNNIAKGIYIYTLQSDSEVTSKRLVIR